MGEWRLTFCAFVALLLVRSVGDLAVFGVRAALLVLAVLVPVPIPLKTRAILLVLA